MCGQNIPNFRDFFRWEGLCKNRGYCRLCYLKIVDAWDSKKLV